MLFLCSLAAAQSLSVEERNERIRERWNRSLVDNENYRFNKQPNNLLMATVEGISPGTALVVAMGQGRNALALARKGWEVTGFDLADKAVAYAMEEAKKEGLELNTHIESYETFAYGSGQWDLITWLYGGCLGMEGIAGTLKEALKPGGLFVFEFFHREAGIGMGRPNFGCEAESVRELFLKEGGFDVLLYEEKEGTADYGMDTQKLIYMVLSKK
jgi:2-polyprenyl-3-methyl-5-hydroxy-6-metoxy-1,4-benzoquinol methylase